MRRPRGRPGRTQSDCDAAKDRSAPRSPRLLCADRACGVNWWARPAKMAGLYRRCILPRGCIGAHHYFDPMSKILISGNWKMNTDRAEAVKLARSVVEGASKNSKCDYLVCPPSV